MKKVISFAYLDKPSIEISKLKEVIKNVEEPSEDYQKEIVDYLKRSMLLDNQPKAIKVKIRSARYVMMSREPYIDNSFLGPNRSV